KVFFADIDISRIDRHSSCDIPPGKIHVPSSEMLPCPSIISLGEHRIDLDRLGVIGQRAVSGCGQAGSDYGMRSSTVDIGKRIAGIDFDRPGIVSNGLLELPGRRIGYAASEIDVVEAEELTKDRVIGNRSQDLGARFDDPSNFGCLIGVATWKALRNR